MKKFTAIFIVLYGIKTYIAVKAFYNSLYGKGTFYPMVKRCLHHYKEPIDFVQFLNMELKNHVKDCYQYQFTDK